MTKKYELLKDDHIEYEGHTLYRIRALKDFNNISAGDLGGYIEQEKNLSQYSKCWVYDEAKVYGNAHVFVNAKIFDNVNVYGNASIFGNAQIYDNAKIHGNSKVYDNAIVFGNAIVNGNAKIYNCAEIFKNAIISKGRIIGKISMPYKDIFIYQCEYRTLTAILTEDNEILYSIGCQDNMTEEEFINLIHNTNGGLEEHPHRNEYLRLIKIIKIYFEEVQNG